MKTFLPHIMIITSLAGLVSCGSKSVGKLEVSQSFLTSNTSFGGGLIITGKHLSTGKSFSRSILSGKEVRMTLDQGAWKIIAIGWDGDTNNTLFAGTPYCGSVEANLITESSVVDLTINQANCNLPEFTAGHITGAGTLKDFEGIITCNSFFNQMINPVTSISANFVASGSANDSFCELASRDEDQKSKVEAVKIYSVEKLPDQSTATKGFSAGCMQGNVGQRSVVYPTNAANPYTGQLLRLPFANLALVIETFEDSACTKPVAVYNFENGLNAGSTNFDHLLQPRTTNSMKLLLPGNDMKRVYSPFMGIMPSVKQFNAGTPIPFATTPSSITGYQFHEATGNRTVYLENQTLCTLSAPQTNVSTVACDILPGNVIKISFTPTTAGTNATFTVNGTTYTAYVPLNDNEKNRYAAQKTVIETLGTDSSLNGLESFFKLDDRDDKSFGALSMVRNMFSGNGPGGVLGIPDLTQTFENSCLGMVADKEISVYNYDRLSLETYRVNIHNSTVASPQKFTCMSGDLNPANCSTGEVFDKRMLVYDYKKSAIVPSLVLEFSCATPVGRLETSTMENDLFSKVYQTEIINWNTEVISNLAFQRFDKISIATRYISVAGSWVHESEKRDMVRLQKRGSDNFEIWQYEFKATGSSVYVQNLSAKRIKNNASTLHAFIESATPTTNADKTYILTNASFTVLQNTTPVSGVGTGQIQFTPSGAFPQTPSASISSFNSLSTDFPTSNLINEASSFKAGALNETGFLSAFGGTFFTSP